jgi:uncharacterized protein (DUF1684 family)
MMAESRLSRFRKRKDDYFREGDQSPLSHEQRHQFDGLAYFEENPALAFELEIDTAGEGVGERLSLATTDGVVKEFIRAGTVHFEADGSPVTLTIFRDVGRGSYYLPFRDGTAGEETYEVGRYLEPHSRPNGRLVVDFNYAYNPYCAYGEGWSCPIPPRENVTKVRIEAGEKEFPGSEHAEPAWS